MSRLKEILAYNDSFVEKQMYLPFVTNKYPSKKMVILTCMDTRLTELLPKAMNVRNGDVKLLKTAGALITEPYGGIMRSLLVAVSLLKAEEIYVIGHHNCGMTGLHSKNVLDSLKEKGISSTRIEQLQETGKIDIEKWLSGPQSVEEAVAHSIEMIRSHPLIPESIPIHGLVIDPKTGKLDLISDGTND